jgi:23S rRNA (guanosine2251-2'-O)-methyltransferase
MSHGKLIFGFHAVTGRMRQAPGTIKAIYLDSARRDGRVRDLVRLADAMGLRIIEIERSRLDGMVGGERHQGVVAETSGDATPLVRDLDALLDDLSEPPLLLVLDGVQDPHNLGACLRVADAMGAHAVLAPKDRAVGLNATVRKVASGAAESVPFLTVTNLARTLRELKARDVWIVGTADEAANDIAHARMEGALAVVMGAEGEGMRRLTRETCDELARIPMLGQVESLNVSVASGICLYEARRQRRFALGQETK